MNSNRSIPLALTAGVISRRRSAFVLRSDRRGIAKGDPSKVQDEVAALLWSAAALRPQDARALAELGDVLLLQGRLGSARETLERALAIEPDSERAAGLGCSITFTTYPLPM